MRKSLFPRFITISLLVVLLSGCGSLQLPGFATVVPLDLPASPTTATFPTRTSTPSPVLPTSTAGLPTPVATLLLPSEPTSLPTDTPGAPLHGDKLPVLPQYTLVVNMDYTAKTLKIQQNIEFQNTSGVEIPDILLAVEPDRIPGVFTLNDLQMDDQPVTGYNLDGQRLSWKLTEPLKPGQNVKLRIDYELALPDIQQGDPNVIRPQIFGVTDRQVNLTDWYPMLVPYDPGSGWRLADPWAYGEHLVYPLANFDVTLTFADPTGAPVVAASAPADAVTGALHYALPEARDFVFAMGRQFKVLTADVDGVAVSSYYYQGNEVPAQAVLDATGKALKTYAELFGPYLHPSLSVIQGDFNDGMEFDGLFYLSNSFYNLYDGTPNNYLVMVAAHETSHQWWWGRLASDQAAQPWLDESLATYCEKLFYEKNYPDSLDWWWAYRINYFQPEGKIDGDVPSYGGFTPYTNATYRLGARFLDELRQAVGDDGFFAFLMDYATSMDGKIATSVDFFRILRQHTQVDLSELLAKYFTSPPQ